MGGYKYKCKVCRQESDFEFCSTWCRKEHARYKKQWDRNAKCSECGEIFVKSTPNHKTCSEECSNARAERKLKTEAFIILERDGFRCQYCGESAQEDGVKLVLDHIYPYSKKGKHTAGNLITACVACNTAKGAKILPKPLLKEIKEFVENKNKQQGINSDRKIRCSATRGRSLLKNSPESI